MYLLKLLYPELARLNSAFFRDPRTSHLPLVGSPVPMVCILLPYVLFVKKWGPALMANRSPIDVKLPMQIYNAMQVLLNLLGLVLSCPILTEFRFLCHPYDIQNTSSNVLKLRTAGYIYYITKYLDLLDTVHSFIQHPDSKLSNRATVFCLLSSVSVLIQVFFVLRKKDLQLSFLHIYHHTIMIFGVWVYMTLFFGSHYSLVGIINGFIHVLMYSYYFVAALKPSFDLYRWKRSLTRRCRSCSSALFLFILDCPSSATAARWTCSGFGSVSLRTSSYSYSSWTSIYGHTSEDRARRSENRLQSRTRRKQKRLIE